MFTFVHIFAISDKTKTPIDAFFPIYSLQYMLDTFMITLKYKYFLRLHFLEKNIDIKLSISNFFNQEHIFV